MKISLLFLRLEQESGGDPPLGLAYIAASLRDKTDLEIDILDIANYPTFKGLVSYLERKRPDILGIYFCTATYDYGLKISRQAKKMGIYVVAGGPHATILPQDLAQEVDVVVMGEGEITFVEAIEAYLRGESPLAVKGIWFKEDGKVIKNMGREPVSNLDTLPFPARDILDMERYIRNCQYFDSVDTRLRATTMIASRGCPFTCTYCQPTLNKLFGKGIRLRSPNNVVKEIRHLRDRYSIDAVFFHDDILTFDKKWIGDFCNTLNRESPNFIWGCNTRADLIDEALMDEMHKAGLRCLHIGAESANQRILDDVYHKGITLVDIHRTVNLAKSHNIRTMCFFMLGAPTETEQEIKQTIKFARRLPLDEAVFNITSPLPGTYLYNLTKEFGYTFSSNWSDFNYYSKRSYNDSALSFRKLKYLQLIALIVFYLRFYRLKYIFRHFSSFQGMRKLARKIKRFF